MEPGLVATGGPAGVGVAVQKALTHPAVVRLANVLKIDLSNDAQRDAVVALAENQLKAASIRAPALRRETGVASVVASKGMSTPYYVEEALKAYGEVVHL